MNAVVQAEHLRKTYNGLVAVDDVSFRLEAGACLGILGPNGAGKTTTIRMLYGFSPRTGGKIRLFGQELDLAMRAVKSRIGVCQQENNLDPDLTVLENLLVFARFFNIPGRLARPRAEELLAFMALLHRRDTKAVALSGGMMRRLVLARSLINKPDLLILDEPTTGLDPQSRHQVWERIEALQAGGLSLLLTTHYMDEAARLCDRVLIMDRGRILVEGPPTDLVRQHVGQDIIEVPAPEEGLRAFVRSLGLSHEELPGRMLIYSGGERDLYREISGRYCGGGCLLRAATLEDVFLRLTGRDLRE